MSIFETLNPYSTKNTYGIKRLNQGHFNQLAQKAHEFDGRISKIRPYKRSDGVKHADDLIGTFHDPTVEVNWYQNLLNASSNAEEYAFELWFSENKIRFILKTPNRAAQEEAHKEITGLYPNAKVEDYDRFLPHIPEGSFIAGGELTLKKTKYAPLRSFSDPGAFEKRKVEESDQKGVVIVDPYKKVFSELKGHQNQAILLQITFRPAPFDWTNGFGPFDPPAERVAEYRREGRAVDSPINPRIIPPTEKDKRTADHIEDLEESQAFEVNIRYFATDKDRNSVKRQVEGIENALITQYQNNEVAQQFEANRFDPDQIKTELTDSFATRKVERNDVILTKDEVAGLAHLPNETINKSNIDFVETAVGGDAPGSASQTEKSVIDDKDRENTNREFQEVEEADIEGISVSDESDSDDKSIVEKAKEIVQHTDDQYYRDSVSPQEYPETSITERISGEVEKRFLEFCAQYEQGTLDIEHFASELGSQERADEIISDFEQHIQEAYIHRANQYQQNTAGDTHDSHMAADQNPDNLPTTPGGPPEQTNSEFDSQGTRQESKLPDTQQKHPMEVVDTEYKQTRSQAGDMLTMSYAEFAKLGRDDEPQIFMGEDLRKLIVEQHEGHVDSDIWLGYKDERENPFREVGVPKESWFKHMSVFGGTGLGKSTTIKNIANQVARKGFGFVMIDPKGDMVEEMMRELPESRLDDVIWIEPGSTSHDKIAAINFLEASVPKDHPRYDREVESIVSDLQAVLRAGEYWGPKMAGITKNITRAMVRSENPYTLYDMYNVLIEQEKRWNFANSLRRENVDLGEANSGNLSEDIKQYSRRIAQMDEEEVDPVVRRLQDWAESPISKEIVAHRHSTVNIDEAVEEGKIILLKNAVEDREIKRVISTAIMRRVWVSIQARADTEKEKDRTPYFAFLDEFDDIVSDDMEIDKMLSKARSGKMSVTLACQNPSQIKDDHPKILKQIFSNTDTMMSFAVTEPSDGRLIADRMGEGFTYEDLTKMEPYRMVTRLIHSDEYGPSVTEPIDLYTFPDYPPLRTDRQKEEAIQRSLDQYGVTPMKNHPGETDLLISGGGLQEQTVVKLLELIWNEQHKQRSESVYVREVANRFERIVGDPIEEYPKGVGVPEEMIEVTNVNFDDDEEDDPFATDDGFNNTSDVATDGAGMREDQRSNDNTENNDEKIAYKSDGRIYIQHTTAEVRITGAGIEAVLKQDSGRSQPTPKHREMIREGFRWFSRLGFDCKVPVQTGENQVCDAEANLPINEDLSISELQDAIQSFVNENPLAAEISNKSNINIEAEGSTQRKPARTIENVLRAHRNGKKAIITVRDGRADGKGRTYNANMVENILTNPPYYRERRAFPPGVDPENVDEDSEPVRHLYNKTEKMRAGRPDDDQEKFVLLPKSSQTTWIDTGDKLLLYDGVTPEAGDHGEVEYSETDFASPNAVNVWCRYDEYQEEWVVYPGSDKNYRYETKQELQKEWQFAYKPLHMDSEVEELPPKDSWDIVILPDPDAIGRDPQSPEENQPETPTDETYEFDPHFPRSEVPLLYEDRKTEPLIPRDSDTMFTGPRDAEESTTDQSDDDDQEKTPEAIMDSFEQIRLEEETKELIRGYKKDYTEDDLKRLDEIEKAFGAKNPAEIDMWRVVWDDFNIEYNTGIPESYLPEAIKGALGLADTKARDAVNIGQEFDLLVEGTPTDPTISLQHADPDDSIYRLVLPEERPDLYCEDVEEYADRNKWKQIWERFGFEDAEKVTKTTLISAIKSVFDTESEAAGRAIVETGVMASCIIEQEYESGVGYELSSERPEEYWLNIWEQSEGELGSPLPENIITPPIAVEEGITVGGAKEILEDAVDRGEIYSPEDAPDDHYTINDPATDEGPAIKQKLGGGSDNDDPDSDIDQSTNGASPDTTDQTRDGETETTEDTSTEQSQSETTTTAEATTADAKTGTDTDQSTETTTTGSTTKTDSEATTTTTKPPTQQTDTDESDYIITSEGEKIAPEEVEERKQELIDEQNYKPLEAEAQVEPPEPDRVEAAMETAVEFCHNQLGATIEENVRWNEDNPDADYCKPETPREYFQHPKYDDKTAAAYEFTPRPEYARMGETDTNGDEIPTQFDISPDAKDLITTHTTVNNSSNNATDTTSEINKSNNNTGDATSEINKSNNNTGDATSEINKSNNNTGDVPSSESTTTDAQECEEEGGDDANEESQSGDSQAVIPYNFTTRNHRGWSPETIDQKKLGWAPRDNNSLRDHLLDEGFSKKELMATGLFNATDDDTLLPFINGRYVFTYFNGDGEAVFMISRSIGTDIDGVDDDYHGDTKYLKPKESHLEEPIYGTQTIDEGQPLVITEGIADAITAHEHGIPCISPVTKKFKDQHYPILEDLILDNNVTQVYIIQDADPPSGIVKEKYTGEYAASFDPAVDNVEPATAESLSDNEAMTVNQKGPGFEGALGTAMYLDAVARREAGSESGIHDAESDENENTAIPFSKWNEHEHEDDEGREISDDGEPIYHEENLISDSVPTPSRTFETYIIELPRFGAVKYDLDDYLSDKMAQVAPPARWVSDIINMFVQTPKWMANLNLDGEIKHTSLDTYKDLDEPVGELGVTDADDAPLPPRATTLNYLPTVGPNNAMLAPTVNIPGPNGVGNQEDVPSYNTSSTSSKELFDLRLRDIVGKDVGFRGKSPMGHYGNSEDYFCVLDQMIAYDHKRKVKYTPFSAALVLAGERTASSPDGSLSPEEKFAYWEFAVEHNLVDEKPPLEAFVHYAIREGFAEQDDLVTRKGPYGEFETLPVSIKDTLFDTLEEVYGVSIERGWKNNNTESDSSGEGSGSETTSSEGQSGDETNDESSGETSGSEESHQPETESQTSAAASGDQSSGAERESESQSGAVESEQDSESDATGDEPGSGASENSAGIPSDDELEPTTTNEEGVDSSKIDLFDDVPGVDDDDSAGDGESDGDGTTRFKTYEEPDLDNPSIDVDIDAVAQFIEHHTTTKEEESESLKIPTDTMITVFTEWAEMNSVDLEKLDPSTTDSVRKGNLTQILGGSFEIEKSQLRIDGDQTMCYHPIALSEDIKSIIE